MTETSSAVFADWLTICTYNFKAYTDAAAFIRHANPSAKWTGKRWLQYAGFHDDANAFYGHAIQSNDKEHYVVKISGFAANAFLEIIRNEKFASNFYCTRLDVQRTRKPPKWWKPRELKDWLTDEGSKCSLIESDTGNTIYIGSRESGRFCRIYEKVYETKYLRLEIELKSDHSRAAYYGILGGASIDSIYNHHLDLLPLFKSAQNDYLSPHGVAIDLMKIEHDSSAEKQLNWLKTLVPKFSMMANDHSIGEQVLDIFLSIIKNGENQE